MSAGPESMSAGPGAIPGAEVVHLWIGDDAVFVRCERHPQLNESHAYDTDRTVPANWMVGVLARHLAEHAAEAADEEPAAPATTALPLDDFGREVVRRCRWAIHHSSGDPYLKWPELYQVAVALVLGNHLYLSDIGPGYTPESAVFLLVSGMTNPPADIGTWIDAIRGEVRQPGDMWSPSEPLGPVA